MARLIAVLLFACCCLTPEIWAQAAPAVTPEASSAKTGPVEQPKTSAPQATRTPAQQADAQQTKGSGEQDPFGQFKEFSTVMQGTVLPSEEREGHIYRSGNLLRMEGVEGRGFYIADLTTNDTFAISTMGCARMKQPYVRSFPFMLSGQGFEVKRVVAGKETVDGHECQIEIVTYGKGASNRWELKIWEAEDLHGFPIKVEASPAGGPGHSTILFKNVVIGPQDPTLFIHPNDCAALSDAPGEQPLNSGKSKKPANKPSAVSPKK
jgi:hypothetical protein